MSKIKVGINGFGRIGRITFRAVLKRGDLEIDVVSECSGIFTTMD